MLRALPPLLLLLLETAALLRRCPEAACLACFGCCAVACRERYPAYWVPTTQVPFWAAVPILVLTGTMR